MSPAALGVACHSITAFVKAVHPNLWPIIHNFVKEQTGTTSEPLVTSSGSLLLSVSLPSWTLNTIKLEELILVLFLHDF